MEIGVLMDPRYIEPLGKTIAASALEWKQAPCVRDRIKLT